MKSSTSPPQFPRQAVFYLEQWIALLTGIACLAVFSWAILQGHAAFSLRGLVAVGWSLTIAVGLLGATLVRFAFYQRRRPVLLASSSAGKTRTAPPTSNATALKLVAANKRNA